MARKRDRLTIASDQRGSACACNHYTGHPRRLFVAGMFPPSKGGLRGARAAAVPNQGELGKAPPTDSNSASKTGPASLTRTSRAQPNECGESAVSTGHEGSRTNQAEIVPLAADASAKSEHVTTCETGGQAQGCPREGQNQRGSHPHPRGHRRPQLRANKATKGLLKWVDDTPSLKAQRDRLDCQECERQASQKHRCRERVPEPQPRCRL